MAPNAVLLVEGQADVDFFAALLRKLRLQDKIDIKPPRTFGLSTNTVSHFPRLIDLLIKRMTASQLHHLGIVADADYVSGGGFENRWKQITERLMAHGYRIPQKPPKLPYTGSIFHHSDLPPIGLWLMPDHASNGMLENLIYQAMAKNEDQVKLITKAETCIDSLPVRLFSDYHRTKAAIYSWLAWQKRPGQTLDVAVNGELIDLESDEMRRFVQWLHRVFDHA